MKIMQLTSKTALFLYLSLFGFLACSTRTVVPTKQAEIIVQDSSSYVMTNKSGKFNFGRVYLNQSITETFTIKNKGVNDLELTGSSIVEITGAGLSLFNVTEQPISPVAPDCSTSFKITFTPVNIGKISATVTIAHNFINENPYAFQIAGTGRGKKGDFNGDGFQDVVVGAEQDDDGGEKSGCAFIFFGSSNMNATNDASKADVKLVGEDEYDSFGFSVSSAGDVNCDGLDDIIIGAYYEDEGGDDAGSAYIFFGRLNWNTIIDAADADVKLVGVDEDDFFGWSVSGAGDVNRDGYDDVIVGARLSHFMGGSAYVFFGRLNMPSIIDAENADVRLFGDDGGDYFGFSVSFAGDVNNDGFDDVIVGAPYDNDGGIQSGCAFIFYGCLTQNWSSMLYAANADVKLIGEVSGSNFGCFLNSAGDVNNDSFDDVIVGARWYSDGGSQSGAAYIYFGKANLAGSVNSADVKLIGEANDDEFGASVSSAGDINNDGFDDIIVGAFSYGANVSNIGCSYIFLGNTTWKSEINASNADIQLIGKKDGELFGFSVTSVGDVNNDGYKDVMVGARYNDDGGKSSGSAFIFLGSSSWNTSINASNADVHLIGEDAEDWFGCSVSGGK